MNIRATFCFIIACSVLALTACGHNDIADIPLGPLTQTGTLTSTGVSLMRRGSHVLSINGKARYYVESKKEDLEGYSGKEVVISGRAEPNIYPKEYLPVIIAEQIRLNGATTELKEWKIPKLLITVTAPADWQAQLNGDTATFSIPMLTDPFVTMRRQTGAQLPPGERLYQQGRIGVRIVNDEAMTEDVRFIDGSDIVSITFNPNIHELKSRSDYDKFHDQFSILISSLQFNNQASSTSFSQITTGTGSGSGMPCGGTAGVLCPSGFYCAITDVGQGIGKCVQR